MARIPFGKFIDIDQSGQDKIDCFDRWVYGRLARSVDPNDVQEFIWDVLSNESSFDVPDGFSVERRLQQIISSFIRAGGL